MSDFLHQFQPIEQSFSDSCIDEICSPSSFSPSLLSWCRMFRFLSCVIRTLRVLSSCAKDALTSPICANRFDYFTASCARAESSHSKSIATNSSSVCAIMLETISIYSCSFASRSKLNLATVRSHTINFSGWWIRKSNSFFWDGIHWFINCLNSCRSSEWTRLNQVSKVIWWLFGKPRRSRVSGEQMSWLV